MLLRLLLPAKTGPSTLLLLTRARITALSSSFRASSSGSFRLGREPAIDSKHTPACGKEGICCVFFLDKGEYGY